jgi:hypothetical protein
MTETTENLFRPGDRVHLNLEGHWLYGDVVEVLPDSSMIVTGYMAKWAKRIWPEQARRVCGRCGYCRALNEQPKCAY